MSAKKANRKKSVILVSSVVIVIILAIALLLTINAKQGQKDEQTKALQDSITKLDMVSSSLQGAVSAYDQFSKDTSSQTAYRYNPGIGALDLLDTTTSNNPSEWGACDTGFSDRLNKSIDSALQSVGTLTGSDQELLNDWTTKAKVVYDNAYCYKGNLIINGSKAKNGTDDFKAVSLQTKGRVSIIQDSITDKKSQLQDLQSKHPLFI